MTPFVKGQDVEIAFVAGYGADLAIDWLPGVLDCFNATHAYVRMRDAAIGPVMVEIALMRHPETQHEERAA